MKTTKIEIELPVLEEMIKDMIINQLETIQYYDETSDIDETDEFREIQGRADKTIKIIKDLLPEDKKQLPYEIDNIISELVPLYMVYYFKRGVRAGLKELKSLSKIPNIDWLIK